MTISVGVAARNAELDAALEPALDSGYLRIYSGSVPANADAALGGATLLAELRFGNPAFPAASSGTKTANAITSGTAAATGTPTFFRALKSDGTTVVVQGSAGVSSGDLNFGNSINSGDTVAVSSFALSAV